MPGDASIVEYYENYGFVDEPMGVCIEVRGRKMALARNFGEMRLDAARIAVALQENDEWTAFQKPAWPKD